MVYTIRIRPKAHCDVGRITAWFAKRISKKSASRWQFRIDQAIRSLTEQPERCPLAHEADELGLDIRELLSGKSPHIYRILFTVIKSTVNILAIRHASQDWVTDDDL